MTYRALHPGKLTQLNASTGDYVPKGHVIARVMWFDELGKSDTESTTLGIAAPFDATVEFFVSLNSHFQKGEPLFRIDPDTPKGRIAPSEDLRSILESGIAAALQNNWEDTQRRCQQVLKAPPTDPSMEFIALKYRALALGFVGYKAGDRRLLDEALAEGQRALSVFQRTSEPQRNLAGVYTAIGNAIGFMVANDLLRNDEWRTLFPEGYAALKKAVELDPDDSQARKHLGIMGAAIPVAKMHGAKIK
jgi:tetratricopeptide (TPR) repeat protein